MSLKEKTVNGFVWSFLDKFANLLITFIVGIILARLLSPKEFGLIGIITIFIAIFQSFIDSGFGNALIRKKDATNIDFSTVFYFNLIAGILFFIILFFAALPISRFFNEPKLEDIIRVLGILLIIDSLTIIQRTILTKRIDFKLQTRISIIASSGSGIIAIIMAFSGFGVWSLVAQRLSQQAINSLLLWLWNKWRPLFIFSRKSFMELFSFGSKLLISGLINTIYEQVYKLIIGKFYSAQDLGYYTRAEEFNKLPSQTLNGVIGRVSFPVLSSIQDDKERLKKNYKILIRCTMLITFSLMLGMAAVAEPMIITLIGEKWHSSIIYLQLMCFVGMMYPLHALNLNILQVKGRSDLFLKLEIIKKLLAIPVIVIGIFLGIKIMIIGMIFNSFVAYFLNSVWSGRLIGYSSKEQLIDLLPSFIEALIMAIIVFFVGLIIPSSYEIKFIIQLLIGMTFIFTFGELTKFKDYLFLKEIFIEKVKEWKPNNLIINKLKI